MRKQKRSFLIRGEVKSIPCPTVELSSTRLRHATGDIPTLMLYFMNSGIIKRVFWNLRFRRRSGGEKAKFNLLLPLQN